MSLAMKMEKKVTKMGNSLGVTMTDELKQLGIQKGDTVSVDIRQGEIVVRKSQRVVLPDGVSPEFLEALKLGMTKYDQTLKGLKDR